MHKQSRTSLCQPPQSTGRGKRQAASQCIHTADCVQRAQLTSTCVSHFTLLHLQPGHTPCPLLFHLRRWHDLWRPLLNEIIATQAKVCACAIEQRAQHHPERPTLPNATALGSVLPRLRAWLATRSKGARGYQSDSHIAAALLPRIHANTDGALSIQVQHSGDRAGPALNC